MENNKYDVIIIFINYNSGDVLINAINSISDDYSKYKIIVLDNFSTDNSLEYINSINQEIEVIRSDENHGFAKGCNIVFQYAIEKFEFSYFLLLNPDAIFPKNLTSNLITELDNHKNAGLISPKITFPDGRNWYSGAKINWKKLKIDNNPFSNDNTSKEVDIFNGCTVLIKKQIIEKYNGFNEHLFMYYDEAEFSLKLSKNNVKIIYTPLLSVKHIVSYSNKSTSHLSAYYLTRNYLYTFIKNNKYNKIISLIIMSMNIFRNNLSLAKNLKFKNMYYSFKGVFHFLINKMGKYE